MATKTYAEITYELQAANKNVIELQIKVDDLDQAEGHMVKLMWDLISKGLLSRSKVSELTGYSQKRIIELFKMWEMK